MSVYLSDSHHFLEDEYDVVVIGSGYGGGIASLRFAEKGYKVCILERGKEYNANQFPATITEVVKESQDRLFLKRNELGLIDYRRFQDAEILIGCGLGGTSLINAGVIEKPDMRVFEDKV